MNTHHWIGAWEKLGRELVGLPAYESLLEEPRHAHQKSMPVWKVFGSFDCHRRGCRGRAWTSTECVVHFVYRYDPARGCGDARLVREFGQECRGCYGLTYPAFDAEAAEKTVNKLVQRIKKVFYGIDPAPSSCEADPTAAVIPDVHSSARLRKFPHNASRCEACHHGVCYYDRQQPRQWTAGQDRADERVDRLEGPQVKIPWSLRIVRGRMTLAQLVLTPQEGSSGRRAKKAGRPKKASNALDKQHQGQSVPKNQYQASYVPSRPTKAHRQHQGPSVPKNQYQPPYVPSRPTQAHKQGPSGPKNQYQGIPKQGPTREIDGNFGGHLEEKVAGSLNNRTDADKLASALASVLGGLSDKENRDDSNNCDDYNYFNYYY